MFGTIQNATSLALRMLRIDNPTRDRLARKLREHIAASAFPCVGAKSALARDNLELLTAHSILSAWDDVRIHEALMHWSWNQKRAPRMFSSFAIVFSEQSNLTELDFERAMWARLQSIADKDHWRAQDYDSAVSPDPSDPDFSLSIGGQAFFVVGLHRNASRPARQFLYPALAFNLHDQFEQLRRQQRYETLRAKIIERDIALAGSANPMLSRHGEQSEARQYSGRAVGSDWQCPFHDKRGKLVK